MSDQSMSEHLRQLFASARAALRPILPKRLRGDTVLVPVVRLSGVIGFSTPLKPGLTLAAVARPLERAFGMRNARAVALLINSPGGSPVQSHLIYRRIRQLAAENERPVIAFAEDVAASGGYMIACAGDEIICDPSSIVGSIGVVGGSFGFVRLMDKLGIERRLYTSGEHKAMLDPFLPENAGGRRAAQGDAARNPRGLHRAGEAKPRERGSRAQKKPCSPGNTGPAARRSSLDLPIGIGDVRSTLRARFGDDVVTPLVSPPRGWFGRVQPGVARSRRFDAPSGFRRGDHLGARGARAVGALRIVRRRGDPPCRPCSSRRWSS